MKNYALSLVPVKIAKERRKQPEAALDEDEVATLRKATGELSWLSRQLRADLAFQAGYA